MRGWECGCERLGICVHAGWRCERLGVYVRGWGCERLGV